MAHHNSIYAASPAKGDVDQVERLGNAPTHQTYLEKEDLAYLPAEHREYLQQRHGTSDLDPIPAYGDADPYNWSSMKKVINLMLVAFHAMMGTFTAAAIIPAYEVIAEDLGISVPKTSYLTSLQIAILGGAPLFWRPLSQRYGRRPVFLISLICSFAGNIGCAKSRNYAQMAACRAIVAFFISPAGAIGSAVVAESFFKKDRARYMGIWTLMITLGVPVAPLIFGFVANSVGYRWIYWILAIINAVQFVLYALFGPETRFIRKGVEHEGSSFKQEYLNFHRIDRTPFSFWEFVQPLTMGRHARITIPAVAYAMVFLFGSVMITVEIPQLFGPKFHFNPAQLGLQFLGIIIGSVIGEQIGGIFSDYFMTRRTKTLGHRPDPEYRLWLSYGGYLLTVTGAVVFLVRIDQAAEGHWNVTPIIGAAIAGVGNQLVTTVLITYAIDCYPDHASSVGVYITFVRQMWGFIGPFWFPIMFTQVGLRISAAIVSIMIIVVSIIPTIFLQWLGRRHRS